jgi:hypothetical protein
MNVRESQIEDVLAAYPRICRNILGDIDELSLVARQKILPSGERIDLLFLSGKRIVLVELKSVSFHARFLKQTTSYVNELKTLQQTGKLIGGEITPYLLCTGMTSAGRKSCEREGVLCIEYSVEHVLESFFATLRDTKSFVTVKPRNHGLWNLHLLNRILYQLDAPKSVTELEQIAKLSHSSILSYLHLASEMLLLSNQEQTYSLTEAGKQYVWNRDPSGTLDIVSDDQSFVLQEIIIENPFSSGAIFGIYTLVDAIYSLSRNTYPVESKYLVNYFRQSCGRYFEWNAKKTANDATRMYSNYAIDIGLIGRIGTKYYLTPAGVKFILLLNLHKAIHMVDSLGIQGTRVTRM